MIGIYKITNIINNKCYVGSSVNIIGRWYTHKTELKFNKHHSIKLQRSYNKHGFDNFKYEIIEECDVELLFSREIYYVDLFNCYENGYNIAIPSKSVMLGRNHSDETKKILRNKSKGNKNRLNMTFTDESKKKISDSLKGRPLSEETKLKMSESHKGKKMTESGRIKLIERNKSRKGIKQRAEVIEHRAKLNTGKKRTEESKKKISDKLKGIIRGPMSDEQKLKRSKRIALITQNGDIIKEYDAIKICSSDINIDHRRISEVLKGKRISFKNLYFKYI